MIKTCSRRNSVTSLSSTTAPSASPSTISSHDLSTDNLVSLDSKFKKKSHKKSPTSYHNNKHHPQSPDLTSPSSRHPPSPSSSINSSTSKNAYYFPNGEVFRPRVAPAKRNRPSKIPDRKASSSFDSSVDSQDNNNDQISVNSVSTNGSGLPRSSSYQNVKKLNKMHLAKNIRESRDNIPTNIKPDSMHSLQQPQQTGFIQPYQKYHSSSSTSLKNQGIARLQSNNILKAEKFNEYTHTSSLSSTASKSSGSLDSSTPSTSIHTDELVDESTKIHDAEEVSEHQEQENKPSGTDIMLDLIDASEYSAEESESNKEEDITIIHSNEPACDNDVIQDSSEQESELTSDTPEQASDQISQHSNDHQLTYDTSISTANSQEDEKSNSTFKHPILSPPMPVNFDLDPPSSSDVNSDDEFSTAIPSPVDRETFNTIISIGMPRTNHRSTRSVYSEISVLPEPNIDDDDDDIDSFVDAYYMDDDTQLEEGDSENFDQEKSNIVTQAITAPPFIINIDDEHSIRIVSPTIPSSDPNSVLSSPNTPKRTSRYFDSVDIQEFDKLLNDTQEEVPPRGDVMVVNTKEVLPVIPESNNTPASGKSQASDQISPPPPPPIEKPANLRTKPSNKANLDPPPGITSQTLSIPTRSSRRKAPPISPLVEKFVPTQAQPKPPPPPPQPQPQIKSFFKKLVPHGNNINSSTNRNVSTPVPLASAHSTKVFNTLRQKNNIPPAVNVYRDPISRMSMASFKLGELPSFEHEESMFGDVIDTFDKKLEEDDYDDILKVLKSNEDNDKPEEQQENDLQEVKEEDEVKEDVTQSEESLVVVDDNIKLLEQEVYWISLAEKELTNEKTEKVEVEEQQQEEEESAENTSPLPSPESDCSTNDEIEIEIEELIMEEPIQEEQLEEERTQEVQADEEITQEVQVEEGQSWVEVEEEKTPEQAQEEQARKEQETTSIIIDYRELNYLFNILDDQQRRQLPSHLKYIRQFSDFKSVEINMKRFEDLTSTTNNPDTTCLSNSILRKKQDPAVPPLKKKVLFSNKIAINETFPAGVYKRFNKDITQYLFTDSRAEITRVKQELNHYKCNEMLVHESSQHNTHFFY
ncbi:hypothetical protein JA1_005448 [Spathaspora sp. JA1]|nr:hypothetical protein JA1_005448 [Spathaspora sp. JA1]